MWHDRWCGDAPLKEVFPDLFECASCRDASIESVPIWQAGGVEWNVTFVRHFNDWEMPMVVSFLDFLYSHTPNRIGEDNLSWKLKRSGLFDISSFYKALRGIWRVKAPRRSIWRVKAPRRVCFFLWFVAWGRF